MRRHYSNFVAALLLLACPAAASAQVVQATAAPKAASCVERLPPSAFTRVAVYAYIDLEDSVSTTFGQTADNFEATIVLTFFVDSTGHAIASSMSDVWPKDKPQLTGRDLDAYKDFLDETKRAAAKIQFNPAEVGGCPVKQLVQMPFMFKLRK